MSTRSRTLYHVSPLSNRRAITRHGLLPSKSRTANHEVWLVPYKQILWAAAHVMARHQCRRVDVYRLKIKTDLFTLRGYGRGVSYRALAAELLTLYLTITNEEI